MISTADQERAKLLFAASRRLARVGRKMSAYQLLSTAMKAGVPSLSDARSAVWLAIRFNDPAVANALVKVVESNGAGDPAWVARVKALMLQSEPVDAKLAEAMISTGAEAEIEPLTDRLCYALSSSPPAISGYSTRTQGIAEGLKHAGLDVFGLTRPGYPWDRQSGATIADPTVEMAQDPTPTDLEHVNGIDYYRIRKPARTDLSPAGYAEAAAAAYQSRIAELRPAAVLAASNWESALPAGIAARRLGLPFFYEVRGFWEMTRASKETGFEMSPLYALWARLEAIVARAADHVFTLTEPMREELIRRGVSADRITLLPNGCNPDEFVARPRNQTIAAQLGIGPDEPVIGYIGSFVNYEGLEVLIDACGQLAADGRDFRLLLVGSESGGPGAYSAALRERAIAQGLGNRIIMPGRVPHDEVPEYYSVIDITPFPRTPHDVTENVSPLKPMEALAMRKAVVISDVRAMADMVQDGKTGLVAAKGSSESLAAVLGRLLSSPELRKQLGDYGRTWVESERDWKAIGARAQEVMRDVMEKRR